MGEKERSMIYPLVTSQHWEDFNIWGMLLDVAKFAVFMVGTGVILAIAGVCLFGFLALIGKILNLTD